ncbi:leucine-rich repeat-containing protein 23 isoform X2 [Nematostella vectensis]|uniref:leucine-rich repeat-containing protein 23 isoform X2 n=1 Tax=Nematostella vectensis TaxID=45351 RepID=UPI0013901708|nr:leucine-rich repeat-containing protein 23 isoform X2 [Nematostella vectensis]
MSDFEDEEGVDEPVMDDENEEEDQDDEKPPENPLTEEMLADSLSLLCKTGNGLAHAYVRLDIHDKELTDISVLNCFIHLRYVDISGNSLKDLSPLNSLTHLLTLKADRNALSSAKLDELPYLQIASFTQNKIMDTEGINHPLLEHLNLSMNEIVEVSGLDPGKLSRLAILELRGNKLMTTTGMNLENLRELYLAANTIRKVEGLDRLEHLTKLHLRDNQIDSLEGFSENMKNLQYLNLRGNSISSNKEVQKLKCLPLLRALVLMENPVSDEDDYRIEVLIALRRLERLDKDEYTEDERQEAEEIYNQRQEEELAAQGGHEIIHTDEDD